MGDSEGITEEKESAETERDGAAPASAPFQSAPSNIPPSDGRPGMRRSSIRPAPPSFKPTTRDSSNLPPPMVIHSGDADEGAASWGAPDLANHPSQVNVAKLSRSEPFALAEDLNLQAPRAHEETLPFVFPRDGGIPQEAQAFAAGIDSPEPAPDSSEVVTLAKHELPVASEAAPAVIAPPAGSVAVAERLFAEPIRVAGTTEPSAHKKRILPIAVALGVLGGCIAVLSGGIRTPHVAEKEPPTPSAQRHLAENLPTHPEQASEAKPAEAKPAEAKPAEAKPAEAKPEQPVAAAAARAAEPAVKTVHVKLVMNPPDAKVVHNGVLVQGPPYEFDIPRGKRLIFEASHKGYVTRKVTLDASKTLFQIGLMAEPKKRR